MRKLVAALDTIPELFPVVLDGAFSLFLLTIATVLSIVFRFTRPDSGTPPPRAFFPTVLVVAIFGAGSSALALVRPHTRRIVLLCHAIIGIAIGAYALWWAVKGIIEGFGDANVRWTPGFLTALVAYPIYLLRRTAFASRIESSHAIRYAHFYAGAIALAADLAFGARIFASFVR